MAASEVNLKDFCARQEIIAHLGRYIENALNPRFKVDVTPGHKPGHWKMIIWLLVGEGKPLFCDIVDVKKEACCPSKCDDNFGTDEMFKKSMGADGTLK
ncbi:hypothetical protein M407DRAFT_30245 [Tulasnella calospora MUT 4182]|uniref:Uncharacterized protein n=1 Tax=Tulasnella calospora MUT 4182 TaxID=1051891 RepID=A0A0C3KF37_9AGAM|nr:hypothetical protein M407DRAFT_30245 [Tulasnella calospora MUT 4182]